MRIKCHYDFILFFFALSLDLLDTLTVPNTTDSTPSNRQSSHDFPGFQASPGLLSGKAGGYCPLGRTIPTAFAPNFRMVFDKAVDGTIQMKRNYTIDQSIEAPAMVVTKRDIGIETLFEQEPTKKPLPPDFYSKGNIRLGVTWSDDIDLDLYASVEGGRKELSFRNTTSDAPKGIYLRDIRSSGSDTFDSYEIIEFKEIDIFQVKSSINISPGAIDWCRSRFPMSKVH